MSANTKGPQGNKGKTDPQKKGVTSRLGSVAGGGPEPVDATGDGLKQAVAIKGSLDSPEGGSTDGQGQLQGHLGRG